VVTNPLLRRPKNVNLYAEACLDALSTTGAGRWISLGGPFGISHYHEYRSTHDVDAWWMDTTGGDQRDEVVRVVEELLRDLVS